jgi:acyl-homoserine-lactone acylase
MMRVVALLTLAASLAVPLAARLSPSETRQSPAADILWDRWGVPHIYAPDATTALYANGWAQAENHGDLLLRLYGQARGRGAEYWGAEYEDTDRWVRINGIPGRAAAWLTQQSPEMRAMLEAFADGINDYARRHADRIADNVEVVLPVSAVDVLAHVQRVIHFGAVTSQSQVTTQMDRWGGGGSNAWAVAPKRSASGHSMLLANPHLPWRDHLTWFESQIVAGPVMVYGATLVGMPLQGIGFTNTLGWTHTNNAMDGADLYELDLVDGGYRWNGGVRPFETTTETLKIRQADGRLASTPLQIRVSVHGPVIREQGGKALALRVAGLDQPGIFEQYWQMAQARNLAEFQTALRRLQTPFYTVMYADRDGHIMHLFGGRTPIRPPGNYNWSGIVPGSSPATLWTTTHPYDDLPKVIDPDSGWLQNANDAPWTTTFPPAIEADRYPSYMASRGMSLRAQQSAKLLDDDPSITFDEFIAYKHSTRMMLADRLLDDLVPPAKAAGGLAARAAEVLEKWDRTADAESRGGVLFRAWFQRLSAGGPVFKTPWSAAAPRTTPDGLRDPTAAVAALADAARQVLTSYGALDVPWGRVDRLRVGKYDLPANGGPANLGIFRTLSFTEDAGPTVQATGGESYVAAIEFGPNVRARTLISYGNATQPGSPHVGDQLELYAKKQLKPAWLTRQETEAHLERRETVRR